MTDAFDPPVRLDQALVALGLADSRARAAEMIRAGAVTVDGQTVLRASTKVGRQSVAVTGETNPWVSRAALKLVHALDRFMLSPQGARAVDVGASTGGFTEVLIARGAAHVIAVDVGRGQLHPKLRDHPKIDLREGVNARDMDPTILGNPDWVLGDVSFISATKALGPALTAARQGATLVTLVKPQFELTPQDIGKGGIVKDEALRRKALDDVSAWVDAQGWELLGSTESPVPGSDGNVEWLIAATKR